MPRASLVHKSNTSPARANHAARSVQRTAATPGVQSAEPPAWDFSGVPTAAPLVVGSTTDPAESAADQAASASSTVSIASLSTPPPSENLAPPIVDETLSSPGQPLDTDNRKFFESRYGHDFSAVKVHSGGLASRSAGAIGARAYTVADHIVLGEERADRGLLSHELAHVVQQRSAPMPWVQRQPNQTPPPKPRQNFVFIMGAVEGRGDANPFFGAATKYFKAHVPNATFVTDKRSLAEVLDWISANVKDPIGDLYIVSHGHEDGTLSIALNAGDADKKVGPVALREALHPKGGAASKLTSVASVVDAKTKIHIKGCDIGRTQEMVELIDEAFGGAGTVTAPTHEQGYRSDADLGTQARKTAHDKAIGDFKSAQPALPANPAPVDPKLKGDARKQAQQEHDAAAAARKQAEKTLATAVAAEEKRITPELDALEAEASTVDTLSGPMFQRPGTTLFKAADIQPDIDKLYPHLPEATRKTLATKLVAPNSGAAGDQQGQKVDRITPFSKSFAEPASISEAKVAFKDSFAANDFTPSSMTVNKTSAGLEFVFEGQKQPPGEAATDFTLKNSVAVPSNASILAEGKANTNNPGRYNWTVDRKHDTKTGQSTLTAVGERVTAYLHHGQLNAGPHDYFGKDESDKDFYTTSTFAPPPPPTAAPATTTKP
jgi:Domain of unknown function (DUF4157)